MNWDALDASILGPAFAAGLLVLFTHVPLGRVVLRRGIIFIDLAVAQIAGLGVIAAHSLGWEHSPWAVQGTAALAALLGALGLYAFGRKLQASLRSRERFWDIRVPKIDSIFDNSLVPRPSWSPGVPPQHRKLVAATHRSPI